MLSCRDFHWFCVLYVHDAFILKTIPEMANKYILSYLINTCIMTYFSSRFWAMSRITLAKAFTTSTWVNMDCFLHMEPLASMSINLGHNCLENSSRQPVRWQLLQTTFSRQEQTATASSSSPQSDQHNVWGFTPLVYVLNISLMICLLFLHGSA